MPATQIRGRREARAKASLEVDGGGFDKTALSTTETPSNLKTQNNKLSVTGAIAARLACGTEPRGKNRHMRISFLVRTSSSRVAGGRLQLWCARPSEFNGVLRQAPAAMEAVRTTNSTVVSVSNHLQGTALCRLCCCFGRTMVSKYTDRFI